MIKQGTRKSIKTFGTILIVDNQNLTIDYINKVVAGDLLIVAGKMYNNKIEIVNVASGQHMWINRHWIVNNTSIAFDARDLVSSQDD